MKYKDGDIVVIVNPPFEGSGLCNKYRGLVGYVEYEKYAYPSHFWVKLPAPTYSPWCTPAAVRRATDDEKLIHKLTL